MTDRPQPWQVAARIEDAAKAVLAASKALDAAYSILLNYAGIEVPESRDPSLPEWEAIEGTKYVDRGMSDALQALSAKYQAIADAEPDGPECPSSPTRRHIVDTSMESGPHNCFHCERSMP